MEPFGTKEISSNGQENFQFGVLGFQTLDGLVKHRIILVLDDDLVVTDAGE